MATEARIVLTGTDKTQAAFASASRSLDALGNNSVGVLNKLSGIGLALTGVGATAAGLGAALNSINAIDAFNDLADATNASVENISALDRLARETGGSFDTASTTLLKFNSALTGAGDDGSAAARVLKALGLDVDELKKKDPAQALLDTAKAFQTFERDGDLARAAQILFSKSIKEVAPFLKDLAEKGELVATTNTHGAEEAEKFNKQLFRMKANAEDVARSFSIDFVVGINKAADAFKKSGLLEGLRTLLTGDDEFKNNKKLVELTDDLLQAENNLARSRAKDGQFGDRSLETAANERRLANIKEQLKTVQGYRKMLDAEAAIPGAAQAAKKLGKVDEPKKPGKDPLAEAKQYLEGLQKQGEKLAELTVLEQALQDMQKGRIGQVSPALEREILQAARLVDAKKQEIEMGKLSTKALEDGLKVAEKFADENQRYIEQVETGYEKMWRQIREVEAAAVKNTLISEETVARARAKFLDDYLDGLDKAADKVKEVDQFTLQAAENIQSALGSSLADVLDGEYKNIGDSFTKMINRMVAEAIAADLSRYLLGDLVKGGSGDGVAGGILKILTGSGPKPDINPSSKMYENSFDLMNTAGKAAGSGNLFGGFSDWFGKLFSFDVGTDYVPEDMVAKIHKGERIIPAAQNKPGFGGMSVTNVFHLSGPVDRRTQEQVAAKAAAGAQRAMARNN